MRKLRRLIEVERKWLRESRSEEARHWNLLADMRAEICNMTDGKYISEPWRSFLCELDCMGGFVVAQLYGYSRTTSDLEVQS